MSYAVTTTPGLIIGSRPRGEAGKLLYIFTRDLGLVMAVAQGIRLERSKLRSFTQDFTLGTFSFVRGKEYWRLTSAAENSAYSAAGGSSALPLAVSAQVATSAGHGAEFIVRLASLLKRLLQGEVAHPELFEQVREAIEFVRRNELSREQLQVLESVVVFRILHELGYIGKTADLSAEILSSPLEVAFLDVVKSSRTIINQHINKALKESQL